MSQNAVAKKRGSKHSSIRRPASERSERMSSRTIPSRSLAPSSKDGASILFPLHTKRHREKETISRLNCSISSFRVHSSWSVEGMLASRSKVQTKCSSSMRPLRTI
jgi:hypothetical protein